MNNPKFYIYGVPDGFNMLSGTPDEILYYQLFYDTSKQGREMRINRKANGETVYSYLIYNLVSCKGREGAFLGMSIAFTGNEYCNNPIALKELFEGIYNKVILKADDKNKIIATIDSGNAVGRFCISRFDERKDMCEKISRIIVNNVVSEIASSINIIDGTFDNNKEGRILTLPIETDNIRINQELRNYTWLSLSSDCTVPPTKPVNNTVTVNQDLLSVHFINELSKKVSSYKDFIIKGLKGLLSSSDIAAKLEEINHDLDIIEEYVGRQPELRKLKNDYLSIYKELVDLKPQQQNVPPRQNLSKIIIGICTILVVVLVVVLGPFGVSNKGENNTVKTRKEEKFPNKFISLLNNFEFKAAYEELTKVNNDEQREEYTKELQSSFDNWFDAEFEKVKNNEKDLDNLQEQIAACKDFDEKREEHNQSIDKRREELLSESTPKYKGSGSNLKKTKSDGIKIYCANSEHEKQALVSVQNNTISCKRGSYFVVEGTTRFKIIEDKNGIEVDSVGNHINISVKGFGQYIVKLNQIEYTFNAEAKTD